MYTDGTIRNKIVVGHSRAMIYLANLATVFTAVLITLLGSVCIVISATGAGIRLFKKKDLK